MINLGHCGEPCPVAMTTWQKDEDSQQVEDTPFGKGGNDGAHANIPAHLKPPAGFDYLTIVDVSGVHFRRINYCACPESKPFHMQLLYSSLFPCTIENPRTAFTFTVVDDFIQDNLECGTSASNYYSKIRRITSNISPHLVPVGVPQQIGCNFESFLSCRTVTGSYSGFLASGNS